MPRKTALLITMLTLGLALLACLPSKPATPGVVKVALAKELDQDNKPLKETTEFFPTETFNCSVKVSGLPKGATLKASWFYGEKLINETPYTTEKAGSGYVGFTLKPEKYWPVGKYRVEIYLGDQLAHKIGFSVVPPEGAITSQVKKVVIARKVDKDQKPVEPATEFFSGETVHCSVNADLGIYSALQARWYHEGKLLEELTTAFVAEENARDTYVDFYVKPSPALATGNYTVEIYLNGELAHTAGFSVKEGEAIPAGMKLYSSEAFSFSILYPSDWEVEESEESVIFTASPDVGLGVFYSENPQGTAQEIAEAITESFKADDPSLETSYSGPYTSHGIDWWEVDMKFKKEDEAISAVLLVTVHGDKVYIILAGAPVEEEEKWLDIFTEMVESFTIK